MSLARHFSSPSYVLVWTTAVCILTFVPSAQGQLQSERDNACALLSGHAQARKLSTEIANWAKLCGANRRANGAVCRGVKSELETIGEPFAKFAKTMNCGADTQMPLPNDSRTAAKRSFSQADACALLSAHVQYNSLLPHDELLAAAQKCSGFAEAGGLICRFVRDNLSASGAKNKIYADKISCP